MALTPSDLFVGCQLLLKVSKRVSTTGMLRKFVSDDFDTVITERVSNAGVTYRVRSRDWRFTLTIGNGEIKLERMHGLEANINQTFTLARLAA